MYLLHLKLLLKLISSVDFHVVKAFNYYKVRFWAFSLLKKHDTEL